MKLDELQREAERLSSEDQRKLLGFLIGLELQRTGDYREELTRRLDDSSPQSWIGLPDATKRLQADGV
ncbi:MAG: hypothetical protein WHV61_10555 [Burkholderiales bacterium]